MRFAVAGLLLILLGTGAAAPPADPLHWEPPGLSPATDVSLTDVLAANARASGAGDPRIAQRRERWTYVNGTQRLSVDVAVRDDDFRTAISLAGLQYMAGRLDGARWRADGNGVAHGVEADLQGDALDRAPQAVFALDRAACSLAGEARLPAPTWVVETRRDGDKRAFLYVDAASGTIVREVMRDGQRVVTTTFDRFAPYAGFARPRHWLVDDGDRANDLDVTVDAIEPGPVTHGDVVLPERRIFAPATPLPAPVVLTSRFRRGRIQLAVNVAGSHRWFDLDTGTTSITVDPGLGRRYGGITLEHAQLADLEVGPLRLSRASVLSIPDFGLDGILGLDFFFGHVIEIDYLHEWVRVLDDDTARALFADPKTVSVDANVDQGLPLVPAAFGPLRSAAFALDTGSPRLHVMRPFTDRFAAQIAATWTPTGQRFVEHYLEGSIELQRYDVTNFVFGPVVFNDAYVGAQVPTKLPDALDVPFDGIIGTRVLSHFDLLVDYDHRRIGLRTE